MKILPKININFFITHMLYKKLERWFNRDYPPLDGRLKAIFFTLLAPLAFKQLIIQIPKQVINCPQVLYHPEGAYALFFGKTHSVELMFELLVMLKYPLMIFWAFSILGLGGRISTIVVAIITFIFWGAHTATSGTGHFWHVPMYTFFILGFTAKSDKYSLDFYLKSKIPSYPFFTNTPDNSSFGRKILLITVVFTFFSAGISKLTLGGLEWLNGSSLQFYITFLNYPRFGVGEKLFHFLLRNEYLFRPLAIVTILFEIGSILALFKRKYRTLFLISAALFHVGILLILVPYYLPQMICYILLIDWKNFSVLLQNRRIDDQHICNSRTDGIQKNLISTAIGTIYTLFLTGIMINQAEWFPFTHVPMYSSVINNNFLSYINRNDFYSEKGLIRIAATYDNHKSPDMLPYFLTKNIRVTKSHNLLDPSVPQINYQDTLIASLPNKSLWTYSLTHSICSDIQNSDSSDLLQISTFKSTNRIFQECIKHSLHESNQGKHYSYQLSYHLHNQKPLILAQYTP